MKNKEAKEALEKILEEYGRVHLPRLTKEIYEVSVFFFWEDYLKDFSFKQHKEEIYKEIDSFMPGGECLLRTKYVDEATFTKIGGTRNSVSRIVVVVYNDIDEISLRDCIASKEIKLSNYKELPKNKNVTEYWLAVFVTLDERADFENFELSADFTTNYARIYLVEPGRCKEIFNKDKGGIIKS